MTATSPKPRLAKLRPELLVLGTTPMARAWACFAKRYWTPRVVLVDLNATRVSHLKKSAILFSWGQETSTLMNLSILHSSEVLSLALKQLRWIMVADGVHPERWRAVIESLKSEAPVVSLEKTPLLEPDVVMDCGWLVKERGLKRLDVLQNQGLQILEAGRHPVQSNALFQSLKGSGAQIATKSPREIAAWTPWAAHLG